MSDPVVTSALVALVGSNVLAWIREWRRGRNGKSVGIEVNGDLKEIKSITAKTNASIYSIDKNLSIVTTEVRNMKTNCHATVTRFEKEINGNRLDIKDLMRKR